MINLDNMINPGFKSDPTAQLTINKFDHYSGSQISVWFGNILIDDISSIQWARSQSKKPIYGYSSQQFDAVAKGTVIIQGNFTVNFRRAGYLSLLMTEIQGIYSETQDSGNWPEVKRMIGLHLRNGTFGPNTSQELIDLGNSPDFMILAKAYEDVIWGGGIPGDDGNLVNLPETHPADVMQHNRMKDGFGILITYGNTSGNDARTMNDYMQSTTKSLSGVHLIGESQVIQVGGQPVLEQYDFIARGSDEFIGSQR